MLKLPRSNTSPIALSAAVWNRAAGEIERLANLQVSPPLELTDGPAGRRLAIRRTPERIYWGIVQCTGPEGTEPDFPDNRYWVALAFVSNPATDSPAATVAVTAYAPTDPRYKVVTTTNFFESNNATHLVRPQTIVRLWAEYDRGSPAQLRWTMIVADEGTAKSPACPPSASSSSSSSSGNSSASSSFSSTSGSGSGSSSICPAGYNGTLSVITALCQNLDGSLSYQPTLLQFCNGDLVAASVAAYQAVPSCPAATSSSGSAASSGITSSASAGSSASASAASSSASAAASSSGSAACLDTSTVCGGSCSDASLPSSIVVNTSALVNCVDGCDTIPSTITVYSVGSCGGSLSPIFAGEDSSTHILATIEWNAASGCFILTIQGSPSATTACQVVLWSGYAASPTATYTRLCGTPGGCSANAALLTISTH